MKLIKPNTFTASMVAITMMFSTACQREKVLEPLSADSNISPNNNAKIAAPIFNATQFGASIDNYLNGKVAGYGYNVIHDSQLVAAGGGGWARKWYETNPTKHSYQVRQGIASSTKFITALTTIAVLEKYNISLDAAVYPYLPVSWKASEGFKKVTFKRILQHSAGLINYGSSWANMKQTVEGPINEANFTNKTISYTNLNYSLMAVILASLDIRKSGNMSLLTLETQEKSGAWYTANAFGAYYRGLARVHVFKKAGLLHWSVVDYTTWNNDGVIPAENGTKGYASVWGTEAGQLKGDSRLNGGSGGLYISTNEFGYVQSAAVEGKIISLKNYQRMKNEWLGFDGVLNGKYGKYSWKNGASNNHETLIIDMGRIQVAIFCNSQASDIGSSTGRAAMRDAYDAAWK